MTMSSFLQWWIFWGGSRRAPEQTLHGGLQKISSKLLSELEFIPYKWAWDASETSFVETNVYVFDPEALSADPDNFAENPPSKRYLDIKRWGGPAWTRPCLRGEISNKP